MQRGHASVFAVLLGHRAGKFLAQRFDPPEERQINLGNCVADEKPAAVALQDLLEVTQKLWQPLGCEILGAPLGFALLIFVIQAAANRMMAVVNHGDSIGDGELELMRPKAASVLFRRESEARAEEEENVRSLAMTSLPAFKNGGVNHGRLTDGLPINSPRPWMPGQ